MLNPENLPAPVVRKHYTDKDRLETVKLYLATGNMSYVARVMEMPRETLKEWRGKEWWKDYETELKNEKSVKLASKLSKLADQGIEIIENRMSEGDYILNQKTGELMKKPIDAKVALNITQVALERAAKQEKIGERDNAALVIAKLDDLARRFEEIASKKKPVQVTDIIYVQGNNEEPDFRQPPGEGSGPVGSSGDVVDA